MPPVWRGCLPSSRTRHPTNPSAATTHAPAARARSSRSAAPTEARHPRRTLTKYLRATEAFIRAVGDRLAIHEWTMPGPSYLHVHRSDHEGWHVLEDMVRFHTAGEHFDVPAGTTVFIPAGTPHTYSCLDPSRYLVLLTPNMDRRLISKLIALEDPAQIPATLAEHDTEIVGWIR